MPLKTHKHAKEYESRDDMVISLNRIPSREWDENADNPLNWPARKKYLILGLVSYIDLLTSVPLHPILIPEVN